MKCLAVLLVLVGVGISGCGTDDLDEYTAPEFRSDMDQMDRHISRMTVALNNGFDQKAEVQLTGAFDEAHHAVLNVPYFVTDKWYAGQAVEELGERYALMEAARRVLDTDAPVELDRAVRRFNKLRKMTND